MTPVEKVAQAIDKEWNSKRACGSVDLARAAIAALREPTNDMVEAGVKWLDLGSLLVFTAMIDAALQESER